MPQTAGVPDVPANQRYGGPKGFLLKMVERELSTADIDASLVRGGGLKIVTTFDKDAQDAAVGSEVQGGGGCSDKKASTSWRLSRRSTWAARASLLRRPDFVKSSRNWAATARPTASTFKTYAPAQP